MATFSTDAVPFQYFNSSGVGDVIFSTDPVERRYVKEIILTVSDNATISFDGTNFFPIANGTYNWNIPLSHIWFGAGTWSGVGIAK